MQTLTRLLVLAAATQVALTASAAEELWTYGFVPDGSRPYFRECYGDCSATGTLADVTGNFSMVLDWQTHTGSLFAMGDQLVNQVVETGNANFGPIFTPYVPLTPEHGFYNLPAFASGNLSSVGDHWELSSDGHIPLAGGGYKQAAPYDITFTASSATLSFNRGLVLHDTFGPFPEITNAHATIVSKGLAGDFNTDGRVDSPDYVAWRQMAGSQADYNLWRSDFGGVASVNGAGTVSGVVPEPGAAILLLPGMLWCGCCRRRGNRKAVWSRFNS